MAQGTMTKRAHGWSLLELMVVLMIIGLIAGLVGPRAFNMLQRGEVSTAELQTKKLEQALLTYRMDVGRFPTTEQGLDALVKAPADYADFWRGPYLEEAVPKDPWHNPFHYELRRGTPRGYVLYSMGADGSPGGDGINADVGRLPDD